MGGWVMGKIPSSDPDWLRFRNMNASMTSGLKKGDGKGMAKTQGLGWGGVYSGMVDRAVQGILKGKLPIICKIV